jgi:hypothetical protein
VRMIALQRFIDRGELLGCTFLNAGHGNTSRDFFLPLLPQPEFAAPLEKAGPAPDNSGGRGQPLRRVARPSPLLRRLSRPRHALLRGGKQLLLAGDVGMPPGCFPGLCSGRGGAPIAFAPPLLTAGLRWRAFSQFDAYHHVLWTTATSVGQAGASPSQGARGLVTRHTPPSTAKRGRTAEGGPRLLQRYG